MKNGTKENIPDFQSIMYPALKYLADEKPHSTQELHDYLAAYFGLEEPQIALLLSSGQPVFKNRIAWAISYMKQGGLVEKVKRGIYQITESGTTSLTKDIAAINVAFLKSLPAYQNWMATFKQAGQAQEIVVDTSEAKTPEELIGDSIIQVNASIAAELLDTLKQKTPAQFEKFVLLLLQGMGYGMMEEKALEIVGQSRDFGIDGIIYQDKLGIDRIYVQAKKWNDNKVQSKEIRDFIGSLSLRGTNKGVFITTSRFTDDALKSAKMNPQNTIILIDGPKLADFAIQFNIGVQVKKQYELKGLDQDFFDEL